MDARAAAAAIEPILEAEEVMELAHHINGMEDSPLRTVLINAWNGVAHAEERRQHAAARFGKTWPIGKTWPFSW